MADQGAAAPAAERRQQAFELRKAGASYRSIGGALGVSHVTARKYVDHVLADLAAHSRNSAEQYRAMHLERLNDMLMALWPQVKRGDQGAIREARACMEREAKLLGLDAPTKIDMQGLLRQTAIAEGLDPDELVREAEQILANA